MTTPLTGLWPPASTPFRADGSLDEKRAVEHGKALLADGAHGLAILGTTSEANSLTLDERRRVIDAFVKGGVPAAKLMPGTGACAIEDAVTLSRHAAELGAAAVLLLPPFYYKKVSDEGLYAFVSAVIDRLGAKAPRIMLYHIPAMAGAGFSIELIGRLRAAYPELIAGIKDSSGDVSNTTALIDAFAASGFAVFPGAETYLLTALTAGAVGCISASANINARGIRGMLDHWKDADAPKRQEALNAVRKAVESRVMIPSLKVVLAERYGDPQWEAVRPPLVRHSAEMRKEILADPAIRGLLEPVAA